MGGFVKDQPEQENLYVKIVDENVYLQPIPKFLFTMLNYYKSESVLSPTSLIFGAVRCWQYLARKERVM